MKKTFLRASTLIAGLLLAGKPWLAGGPRAC